jgi:hypothetical protein
MPIQTPHPSYTANIDIWNRCRAAYDGDDAIKSKGREYLPQIDANQTGSEYDSYARRASFFECVGKTVDSFVGAISRKPSKFDLPTGICAMEYDATGEGVSLSDLAKVLCKETILQGRVGILVDLDDATQRPYLTPYTVESITNWSEQRVVLHENVFEPDPTDDYSLKSVEQYRELTLVDGVYTVRVWRRMEGLGSRDVEWYIFSEIVPKQRGKLMTAIPFFFVTPLGQTSRIEKPPMLGLVNLSLEHFRLSADYAHSLHWTALPTLYITGADDNNDPISLGGANAIILKNPAAKVGFAEFTGSGLSSLERAIEANEKKMASLGAAILGAELRRQETAEAARIRHGGETSLLVATVTAVQASLQASLECAAEWVFSSGEVKIELNNDFISTRLDPQTLLGLVQAFQAGALTIESLLQAMQDGDLLPQKAIITDEVATLAAASKA